MLVLPLLLWALLVFFFFFFCLIVICRFLILHIFIHHVARGMGRPSQTWRCDMYVYLAHNT